MADYHINIHGRLSPKVKHTWQIIKESKYYKLIKTHIT